MKIRLLNFWKSVEKSFWFIPGMMVLSAMGLSFIMVTVDTAIGPDSFVFWGLLYSGGTNNARYILTTIAGSMITVAGVVFSITIVSLSLAASQFGPRLLRNFIGDKGNQLVLGTFVATFIYCLLVLGLTAPIKGQVFVPTLSTNVAIILALASIGVLIYFINHIATSIQADYIIVQVHTELSKSLERLFPEELVHQEEALESMDDGGLQPQENAYSYTYQIIASQTGYVQAVDKDRLLEIASNTNGLFFLHYRPGDFVFAQSAIVTVKCNGSLAKKVSTEINTCFIVGKQKTSEQNAEFSIDQLVEIAIRALSPGINDPFTAIACIDKLGDALCYLTTRAFPSAYRYDEHGKLRIIIKPETFTGITNAAFDQIRQYGRSSVAVTVRLLETFTMIAPHVRNDEHKQAILRQAEMISRTTHESIFDTNDTLDVQQRYAVLLKQCEKNT